MSALPPKADIRRLGLDVRLVPIADIRPTSLDHLVGKREQLIRHVKAKRPSGLQINHQLELSRLGDWQVARIVTLENATSVDPRLTRRSVLELV